MTPVMAIDCDLHRIHCWCSECGLVCKSDPRTNLVLNHACHEHGAGVYPALLFEIGSPVSGARENGNATIYNVTKWLLWNMAMAATLARTLGTGTLLVAPSNVWTRGHPVKTRHAISGATASTKDLRECQAMIWFFRQQPALWKPFHQYLEAL